jgi:replicative DNA helicase
MTAGYREFLGAKVRVPPHSNEAEQSVLGALMLGGDATWWEVCDVVSASDFYRKDHRMIFEAIADLVREQKPFDAVTLGDWFAANNVSDLVGGVSYVIELANTTPSARRARHYAEIVAEKAMLRGLIDAATEAAGEAFEAGKRSAVELVGAAQTRLANLLGRQPCELESIAPVMDRVWTRLADRFDRGAGEIHGLTTGFPDLDELLGGLGEGQLIVLAARPKMGKTSLAQNISEHVAISLRKRVAIFSFEMQPDEIGDRLLASQSGVAGSKIKHATLDEEDWSAATTAYTRIRGAAANLFISKPRQARVEHVIAQARREHARSPLSLIVIDYLQLMDAPGDNRAQALGDITRALKLMAGEMKVPVLLLSQLSRKLEDRTDKRPIPSDLRDSGAIEQDADVVAFIYRDEVYDKRSRYKGTAEIIVALQRNGPPGDVRVEFLPDRFRFRPLPESWIPMAETEDDVPRRKPKGLAGARKARSEPRVPD